MNVGANGTKCSLFVYLVSHRTMRGQDTETVKLLSGKHPNALEPLRIECEQKRADIPARLQNDPVETSLKAESRRFHHTWIDFIFFSFQIQI